MDLVAPGHVGSSWIRGQTRVSCVGRQILYHWATRKAPSFYYCLLVGSYFMSRLPKWTTFEGSDYSLSNPLLLSLCMLCFCYICCCYVASVMSDSVRPQRRQPTRLPRPWDFPGKRTGVGCHFLLQVIFPIQGSNPGLPHCRQTLYCLSYQGSHTIKKGHYKMLFKG